MVSDKSLVSCLCNLGCKTPSSDVLKKCLELCENYNLDEEILGELWVSFSTQRNLDFDPTVDALNQLEKSELKSSESILSEINESVSIISIDEENTNTSDVLNLYGISQPSTSKQVKRIRSPDPNNENKDGKVRAVDHTFSPSTYTPKSNTPSRAPSTALRGKVLLNFGPNVTTWQKESEYDVCITKSTEHSHVPKDALYMYEVLSKQGAALSSRCDYFAQRLRHLWNETGDKSTEIYYDANVQCARQTPFRTWGRVSTNEQKLSGNKLVTLEGVKKIKKLNNNAPTVSLDLNELKHYSVFPGQIITVEGINSVGNLLVVKEIFSKGYAPLSPPPTLTENLRVYVAVGPFTAPDNLNYQPLWDLMERVVEEEPNVLILVGPFLEYSHREIQNTTVTDTYQELFEKIVSRIMQSVKGKCTRVVLVPSYRDVHHDSVFPTSEFPIIPNRIRADTTNLYAMPDPCVLDMDGLKIGVTSIDNIKHLGQLEVSNTSGMDRLGRLTDHVLSQATFYPLYPPFPSVNIDTTLWAKHACIEQQPHIMILPSDVRYYCKTINECLVVNPERLQKYIYAKLYIRPSENGKWNLNNISCVIGKV